MNARRISALYRPRLGDVRMMMINPHDIATASPMTTPGHGEAPVARQNRNATSAASNESAIAATIASSTTACRRRMRESIAPGMPAVVRARGMSVFQMGIPPRPCDLWNRQLSNPFWIEIAKKTAAITVPIHITGAEHVRSC